MFFKTLAYKCKKSINSYDSNFNAFKNKYDKIKNLSMLTVKFRKK